MLADSHLLLSSNACGEVKIEHENFWTCNLIDTNVLHTGPAMSSPYKKSMQGFSAWRHLAAIHQVKEDFLVSGDSWQQAGRWQHVTLGHGAHVAASGMSRLTSWQSLRTQ